jgi:hypothetical protein
LNLLVRFEEGRQGWVKTCFPDTDNAYDAVWHDKLVFLEVDNGDAIALDLKFSGAPVVYLSHDGSHMHGYRLGDSFVDFMERWSLLGCPGADDWQMEPFISSQTSGLEPYGEKAKQWCEWFGLTV